MYDTHITIVGTALTTPEKRIVEKSGAIVAHFRVVSNSRRFDKENERWVDGAQFRAKVNCWRRLGDHVAKSIQSGDPVIVHGRITTREWQSEQGEARLSYEIDAYTVGHDLSRGLGEFKKMRYDGPQSVVEDAEADGRVNGEVAHPLDPAVGGEEPYADGDDEGYAPSIFPDTTDDALTILRDAGLDESGGGDEEDEEELVGAAGSGGTGGRRRRGR